jgi:hypothetical protein
MEVFNFKQHLEDFIQTDLNRSLQSERLHNNIISRTQSNFPRAYILGDCYGIMLHPRGVNDLHVCFAILVEDDGFWYFNENGGGSSFWLSDLRAQVFRAEEWCKQYALPDNARMESDRADIQYGYKFKPIE